MDFVSRLAGPLGVLSLAGSLFLAPTPRAVAETAGKLADHLPGYSIARLLFPEGRMVLEHEGEFLVLRKGDTLPGMPGVKVLQLDAEGALLAEAAAFGEAAGSAVPERMIKITQTATGTIDVTLLTARPPQNEELDMLDAVLAVGRDGQPITAPQDAPAGAPASGVPASGVPAIQPTQGPIVEGAASETPGSETDVRTSEDPEGRP